MSFLILMTLMTMTSSTDMIVTSDWVAAHLDDPNMILVEVGQYEDFQAGHIPGARFVDAARLVVRQNGVPDEMPSAASLEKLFGGAGIGNDGRIVIYSREPLLATRMWFTLDYLGHGDRAAILDGGYPVWKSQHGQYRPVTRATIRYKTELFTASVDPSKLLTIDQVREAVASGSLGGEPVVILDARPVLQYTGKKRGSQISNGGHIPASECAPWTINYTDVAPSTFKSTEELEKYYSPRVDDKSARIILYCRTGMEASSTYFSLRRLGYTNISLYDGSYIEWNKSNEVVSVAAKTVK